MAQLERKTADCDEGTFGARYDKLYQANTRDAMRAGEELMRLREQYGYGRRQEFTVGFEDGDCQAGCPVYEQRAGNCYECRQNCMVAGCEQGIQYRVPGQLRRDVDNPFHASRKQEATRPGLTTGCLLKKTKQ